MSLRLVLLLMVLVPCALGCQRKDQKAAPRPSATRAAKRPPRPLPPEPPFGPLEVADSGFPCDVEAVLKGKCRRCHTVPARHGAPFPLLTWQQAQEPFRGSPIWGHMGRAVKSGFMPYRIQANPPIELLTDAEKQVIVDWAESGAPQESCPPVAQQKKPAPAKRGRSMKSQ